MAPSLSAGVEQRADHAAVWTGSEMIVWGGYGAGGALRSGGAYHPTLDTWRSIPDAPGELRGAAYGVWTGKDVIVNASWRFQSVQYWGFARFDPVTDTWTEIPGPPLEARTDPTIVWSPTTEQLLVWGGEDGDDANVVFADGAAYDVASGTWDKLPAAPLAARTDFFAGWDGQRLLVAGGRVTHDVGAEFTDAMTYDPGTGVWSVVPDFTLPATASDDEASEGFSVSLSAGGGVVVWGGNEPGNYPKIDGAFWDGAAWSAIPALDLEDKGRLGYHRWTTGDEFCLWGGRLIPPYNGCSGDDTLDACYADSGACYDPLLGTWTELPPGGPSLTYRGRTVWTGEEAILWGGRSWFDLDLQLGGMIYRPE